MLRESVSRFHDLADKISPRGEFRDHETLELQELTGWHARLGEAVESAAIAELLWSADVLKLNYDLDRLTATEDFVAAVH